MPQSVGENPAALAREFFAALAAKQWAMAASLIHEDALDEFRNEQVNLARAWERPDSPGEEPAPSGMPPAVLEFFSDIRKHAGNPAVHFIARINSLSELEQLAAAELFARWLEGRDPDPAKVDSGTPPTSTRTIIGDVRESPSTAHVVYRVDTDVGTHGRTTSVEVLTVRQSPQGWRAFLNRDIGDRGTFRAETVE